MIKIPLITSLPPRMTRTDEAGVDIGKTYQEACLASWGVAGFEPVSVNSAREEFPHAARRIPVDRDASALTGRPHVYLADMLRVAVAESRGGPFALTNADIVLPANDVLATRVANLEPGEFIFSRRLDVRRPGDTTGPAWTPGFDFFAGRGEDIADLRDAGFVFGAPWWDHYLPLAIFMRGQRVRQTAPTVLHLDHTERWNLAVWESFGSRFLDEIKRCATDARYRRRLADALARRTGRPLSDLKYSIWKRLPAHRGGELRRTLERVSALNVAFLDEMTSAPG